MLLEFGFEIDANSDFTEINPDFVDRSGVVHPDAGEWHCVQSVRSEMDVISGKLIMWSRWFPGKTLVGNAGGVSVLAGKEQEPRFRNGAVTISVARVPSGVCSQACACSI